MKWLLLVIFSAATLAFHYGLITVGSYTNDLSRRMCYLPILLGAFWFGTKGGISVALGITIAVIPHTVHVSHLGGDVGAEFIEMVFYIFLGTLFGILVDREKHQGKVRQETERQLVRAEHLSSLGEMAAHLAHEIKNPLGSIRGAAEIITPDLPDEGPKREFANILLQEVDRLNRVVEDFLKYARPLELKLGKVNIHGLLDDVAKQLELAVGDKNINVEVEHDEDTTVYGDESKLRQVFLNLGLNSINAMHNGGTLKFSIRNDSEKGAAISVSDTGTGIPDENIKKIFDPFFTTSEKGSGLGLAICEKIIVEHGGHIEVESKPAEGATFKIILTEG